MSLQENQIDNLLHACLLDVCHSSQCPPHVFRGNVITRIGEAKVESDPLKGMCREGLTLYLKSFQGGNDLPKMIFPSLNLFWINTKYLARCTHTLLSKQIKSMTKS